MHILVIEPGIPKQAGEVLRHCRHVAVTRSGSHPYDVVENARALRADNPCVYDALLVCATAAAETNKQTIVVANLNMTPPIGCFFARLSR